MEEAKIFVYGTLLQGFDNHHIIAKYIKKIDPGEIAGKIYHISRAGYPAVILEQGRVVGELITIASQREALTELDVLEGYRGEGLNNLYNRVIVKVTTITGPVDAFCYVWPPAKSQILKRIGGAIEDGDWKRYMLEIKS